MSGAPGIADASELAAFLAAHPDIEAVQIMITDPCGVLRGKSVRHEELQRIYGLRRAMQGLGPIESMEMLITRLKKTKSNAEFLLWLSRT